jgi:hypothetical protein
VDLDEITAHMEIRQALVRYCRGVDRGDAALIKSAFHPDAFDRHGASRRLGHELADSLAYREGGIRMAGHHITNVYIELHGPDVARVESYVLAFVPSQSDGAEQEDLRVVGARYLDRFERRDGEWRVADRLVVVDWSRHDVPGDVWMSAAPEHGGYSEGCPGPDDPSYQLFASPFSTDPG